MGSVTSSLSDVSNGRLRPAISREQESPARNRLGAAPDPGLRARRADADEQKAPPISRVAPQLQPLTEDYEAETARGLLTQMIIQMGGAPQSTYKGMYIDQLI